MPRRRRIGRSATKPSGLVGYWRFDELGGLAFDTSGSGNHGQIVGATRVAGKNGGGLDFDVNGEWVKVASSASLNPTSAITLCTWIYPRSDGSGQIFGRIIEKGDGVQYELSIYSGDDLYFDLYIDSGFNALAHSDFGGADPWNKWYHFAGTWENNAKMKVYVNGLLKNESGSTISGSLDTSSDDLGIGGSLGGAVSSDGIIDDVRIYNVALSATEILKIYNDTK